MFIINNTNDLKRHINLLEKHQEKEWENFKNTSKAFIHHSLDPIYLIRGLASLGLGFFSNSFVSKTIISMEAASIIERHSYKIISLLKMAFHFLRRKN